MGKVILRVQSTECHLATEDMTIERILSEARAVGMTEFAVTRNGVEVESPDDFAAEDGDLFVILPADYDEAEIFINVANDDEGNETIELTVEDPNAPK